MLGTVPHPHRSGERASRLALAALLLCLAMLLPALPVQSATAAPEGAPVSSLRAQQPDQPLIAFLRQGNLWLMNEDGSDRRQVTIAEAPVEDFSWSSSGRYLVFQHGGRYRVQRDIAQTDLVTELLDTATGEITELRRMPSNTSMSVGGSNLPVWAPDADELLLLDFDPSEGRTYALTKISLDGTATVLASFEEPYICGGPDGPFATIQQLTNLQRGGPWTRRTYDPVMWRSADPMAYAYVMCGTSRAVDLSTGGVSELPYRPLMAVGDRLMVQGEGASSSTPNLYDPATGSLQPLYEGDVFTVGPDGTIYFTRIVQGVSSTFVSRFDDGMPFGITDNTVELWRTGGTASEPVLIASMPAFGAGVPRITGDGSAVVLGTVDNPTDMIGVDESGAEGFTPELYANHLKAVRVDIATGEVTVLTDHAILPKPQPAGTLAPDPAASDEGPTDLTGTPEEAEAATTPETQFIDGAPIFAITCTTTYEGFFISGGGGMYMPEGCGWSSGARFSISGLNGEDYGGCTVGSDWWCDGDISLPVDVEVIVTVDESTIPEGYAVVGGNPQRFTFESRYLNTDAAQWLIVLMPADVAAAQGPGGTAEATETATEAAAETGSASGLTIEPGSDWIAYTGEDGNIWLMQPDGSQRTQVTTDGAADFPYRQPSWSHDGAMLAFTRGGADEKSGIWVLREGELSLLPNTGASCHGPAFSADNQRVLYTCPQNTTPGEPVPADLTTNPLRGYVTSSALDGSGQRVEVPYTADDSGVRWISDSKGGYHGQHVDVRPSDGLIMVVYSGHRNAGVHLFSAEGALTGSFDLFDAGYMWLGPFDARLTPDGEAIIATVCTAGCFPSEGEQIQDVLLVDLNGNVVGPWTQSDPGHRFAGVDMSPDGTHVVTAVGSGSYTDGTIVVYQAPMQPETIGPGLNPAWQPNANVAMERPASAASSGAASSTESTAPAPAAVAGAVPTAFIATWSGRGVQENPYGEWAVTISITGGGIGEVVGMSEYPEESCGGNLVLQEVTADSIVLLEQLTYGQGTCADNGTITLSGVSGGGCQFAWSGIGPYGTPSTAGGTLSRPDSAAESSAPSGGSTAAPSGDQSYGPAQDTTQLHPDYVGTYGGTGNQTAPDNQWPITVTFTGGRPGEVIGTVEYPTLGCGGELILVSINPVDEWRGFRVTERITYGHDTCIDGGTFGFSSAESGIGITFIWTSPVSATRASGHLPEVDPGDAPAPVDQSTEASGAGQGIEPAEGDASGGPPSIYDDPEAEPVPIEAEGGG